MRVDIDQQDILNALADTRKRFDRARAGLMVSLSLTTALFLAAGFASWRAIAAIMSEAPSLSVNGLHFAFDTNPQAFYALAAASVIAIVSACLFAAILKARCNRAAARKEEALGNPLNSGRFEFIFSTEKLTIMGPLSVKKISWNNFAAVENRKSSIIFHHKDGRYDFIPKNVIPNDNFFDLMMVKHGALLNKACSYEDANLATPLSVTYEETRADHNDYYAQYFKKRDGRLYFLRRLCQWRPWTPFLFLAAAVLAAAFGYKAFNTYSLLHAGAAIACCLAAGAIFMLKASYFRGPAHPFRKPSSWPYGQTDLATVNLAKDGVFHTRHGVTDFVRWGALTGYVETKLFGYLVIAPKHVIALPKRAFLDKAHFDDFTAFAKRSMSHARKEKSDADRGRMMRSLGDKETSKKAPQETPAETTAPKPRQAPATAHEPRPTKPVGPSPKAAPAQVERVSAAAPQIKPAPAAPPVKAKAAPQQPHASSKEEAPKPPASKKDNAPAPKPAARKSAAPKPSSETIAILNAALKKAAEMDAKRKQEASSQQNGQQTDQQPEKKTAAE